MERSCTARTALALPSSELFAYVVCVPRVAAAAIRGRGLVEGNRYHHYGVWKTFVVAAAASVYQEPHFWKGEGQEIFAFLFDQKVFAFESIAAHDLI